MIQSIFKILLSKTNCIYFRFLLKWSMILKTNSTRQDKRKVHNFRTVIYKVHQNSDVQGRPNVWVVFCRSFLRIEEFPTTQNDEMFALCKLLWIIHMLIADKERSKQQFSVTYLIVLLKIIAYLHSKINNLLWC